MKNNTLSIIAILSACVIWGLNSVLVKMIHIDPIAQTFYRLLVPTLLTWCILIFRHRKNILRIFSWRELITISWWNALRMLLLIWWFGLTSVGNAVLAQRSNIFLILIFAWYFLGEKLTRRKIISFSLGLLWLIVVATEKESVYAINNLEGILLIIGSALLSWYLNIQYKQKIDSMGSTWMIFIQSYLGVVIFWIWAIINRSIAIDVSTFRIAILHSTLIGVVGFYLFFWWMKYISLGNTSLLTYTEVVAGMFWGYILLGETPSYFTYIGALLIIASSIILIERKNRYTRT